MSAAVICGLPNLSDYVYKQRDELMEEKGKEMFDLACEMTSMALGYGHTEERAGKRARKYKTRMCPYSR
jgi:hypothetical protein